MGLFGGDKIYNAGPAPLSQAQFDETDKQARKLTAATPEELAMLAKLGISAEQADQGMLDQIRSLGERGDDLGNVNQDYMDRAYQPAFERLMTDYSQMDQGVIENMNKRGIASVPGGASEPEAYQRSLLARDTKRTLGQTMLQAQNQAVEQKLAQYNARLAEPNLAATRYGQTMTPLQDATITPESTRMQARTGAAGNIYNAKLGYQSNTNALNQDTMKNKTGNTMSMIGGGMGLLGSALGTLGGSSRELKKDIHEGPDPEQDLAELTNTPIDRWKYRFEDQSVPEHEGVIADQAPEDIQGGLGIDVPSYLGKLTNAVKALNQKMSAYDRLMQPQEGGM